MYQEAVSSCCNSKIISDTEGLTCCLCKMKCDAVSPTETSKYLMSNHAPVHVHVPAISMRDQIAMTIVAALLSRTTERQTPAIRDANIAIAYDYADNMIAWR